MQTQSFMALIIISAFLLASCTPTNHPMQIASNLIHRQTIITTTKESYPAKSPQAVALYHNKNKVLTPYRIIGVAKVSKYNLIGKPREEATVHEMLKKLAASIGGDALINIDSNNESMQANVIAFQKILL